MESDPSSRDIVDLYERNADGWNQNRGTVLHEPHEPYWLRRFTELLPPGGTVLDLGCGTGAPIARHLSTSGFAVTGVDSAPSLVAIAARRDPVPGSPAPEWIVDDMRSVELNRKFDGLLAWYSLFHLIPEDQRPMFARFARHAAPGAALMFTSGPAHGDAIGEWRGDPLYHGSLAPAEYRHLLNVNGFDVISHRVGQPVAEEGPTVWLARAR